MIVVLSRHLMTGDKTAEFGGQLEKLYKDQAASLDIKKVLALCEKYWPIHLTKETSAKE